MKKRKVLFVDDDELFIESIKRNMRRVFFDCDFEYSAEGAMLKMRMGNYDVVVLDNNMPGMGGVAMSSEIAKEWPGVVVIMISGNYLVDDLTSAINYGHIYKALTKPCGMTEIMTSIVEALKHKAELELLYKSSPSDEYYPDDGLTV